MAFERSRWSRLEYNGTPIYVDAETPSWFVPNAAGDQVLRNLPPEADVRRSPFLQRLPSSAPSDYSGREQHLSRESLRELWLHVTDHCNMACTHCLFASGANRSEALSAETLLRCALQASQLGCRVFALTGGEPFVYPQFERVVDELLALPEAAVVVLTNGTQLRESQAVLERWANSNFHLQVSVDGLAEAHDAIRGPGAHRALTDQLAVLRQLSMAFTVSICVTRQNVADLPGLVDYCARVGATNLHLMWYFVRGRGRPDQWVEPEAIFPQILEASDRAARRGIAIDNLEALQTQAFAPSGTRHDGSNSGWESVAIGPDGHIYPSPATIGVRDLGWPVGADLEAAWRESPALGRLRRATAAGLSGPLRFLTGGGDSDHSYLHSGRFLGDDPYLPLHERLLLHLIAARAATQPDEGPPAVRLKMGDVLASCGAHGGVALTHSNCLLAVADSDGRTAVRDFYTRAAETPQTEILNPVHYAAELLTHIPEASRVRSYGCGSPVLDADIQPGQCVVDLGSGSGVECFIAARLVGPQGTVIGVDMLEAMLQLSRRGAVGVAENLGYRNVEFRQGYLEQLPLEDATADVVISNCVINLAVDKRRLFAEVFRILKRGGQLVVSDVVCETDPPASIRNDDTLRGECIGGALTERDLYGLLAESGFSATRVVKRFPYRTVAGHPFFSLTFRAVKPAVAETVRVIYRGPLAGVTLSDGTYVPAGVVSEVPAADVLDLDDAFFQLDEHGGVVNVPIGESCCCGVPSTSLELPESESTADACCTPSIDRQPSGCMVCGTPLQYLTVERDRSCVFCGRVRPANAVCGQGHYVCDACHAREAVGLIEHICCTTTETDMLALMQTIRSHPAVPINGPEHHALAAGIILATYRNLGGQLTDGQIRSGIRRGTQIPGGGCGLFGVCGAAVGVGIAIAIILESNPLKGHERSLAQTATGRALRAIAELEAPRCCQRDLWLALRAAREISRETLPITLRAEAPLRCTQIAENRECIGDACPLLHDGKQHAAEQSAGAVERRLA